MTEEMRELTITLAGGEVRELPWAGINTAAADQGQKHSLELLKKGGLDFDVDVRPLWRKMSDGTFKEHPRDRETFRTDTEATLGTVRGRYRVFANREAFSFADQMVADGAAEWAGVGQRGEGRQVFMTLRLGAGFTVAMEDAYQLYLLLRTSHDGSGKVTVDVVPFRMQCLNQSQLVLKTAKASWGVSHTADVASKVQEAREALKLTSAYSDALRGEFERLLALKVSEDNVDELLERVVDEKRHQREKVIDGVKLNYLTSPTVDAYRGTAYGLLNGLTEWFDHAKEQRTADARYSSITSGEGAKTRNRLLVALAA